MQDERATLANNDDNGDNGNGNGDTPNPRSCAGYELLAVTIEHFRMIHCHCPKEKFEKQYFNVMRFPVFSSRSKKVFLMNCKSKRMDYISGIQSGRSAVWLARLVWDQ